MPEWVYKVFVFLCLYSVALELYLIHEKEITPVKKKRQDRIFKCPKKTLFLLLYYSIKHAEKDDTEGTTDMSRKF